MQVFDLLKIIIRKTSKIINLHSKNLHRKSLSLNSGPQVYYAEGTFQLFSRVNLWPPKQINSNSSFKWSAYLRLADTYILRHHYHIAMMKTVKQLQIGWPFKLHLHTTPHFIHNVIRRMGSCTHLKIFKYNNNREQFQRNGRTQRISKF